MAPAEPVIERYWPHATLLTSFPIFKPLQQTVHG